MNLATRAFKTDRKPTKQQAMGLIAQLENELSGNEGSLDSLAMLYKYFMPSAPSKPKTPEQWVIKAVAKKDVRYYLNRLHVEDNQLIATDGSRLHVCHTDLPNGAYDSQLNPLSESEAGIFPNWKQVIPNTGKRKKCYLRNCVIGESHTQTKGPRDNEIKGNFIGVKVGTTNMLFTTSIWLEGIAIFGQDANVYYDMDHDSVYIEEFINGHFIRAVIMPVRKY